MATARQHCSGVWARALRKVALAGVAASVLCGAAGAQEARPGVLLELFTSQGCSSCPPADDLLAEVSRHEGVIALSLHVDYWDYIGWQDTFGHALFTERQKAYARAQHERMIYTPQMIVGGEDVIVGTRPMEVVTTLQAHAAQVPQVTLRARRDGNTLTIRVSAPEMEIPEGLVVDLVRYLRHAEVAVTRGENAGHDLTHANVVTAWRRLATWPGLEDISLQASVEGEEPLAVVVQRAGNGAVLAAASID